MNGGIFANLGSDIDSCVEAFNINGQSFERRPVNENAFTLARMMQPRYLDRDCVLIFSILQLEAYAACF